MMFDLNFDNTEETEEMKAVNMLIWELIVSPHKQDRVVWDIDSDHPGNENNFFGRAWVPFITSMVKKLLSEGARNLDIEDGSALAEKHPGGFDEFKMALDPEHKVILDRIQQKLQGRLSEVSEARRARIPIIARRYQEERLKAKAKAKGEDEDEDEWEGKPERNAQ